MILIKIISSFFCLAQFEIKMNENSKEIAVSVEVSGQYWRQNTNVGKTVHKWVRTTLYLLFCSKAHSGWATLLIIADSSKLAIHLACAMVNSLPLLFTN